MRVREYRLLREALSGDWCCEECASSWRMGEACTLALVADLEVSKLACLVAVPRCPVQVRVSARLYKDMKKKC